MRILEIVPSLKLKVLKFRYEGFEYALDGNLFWKALAGV
jgi:hypothetical protein